MTPIDNPPPAAAGGWTRRVAANIETLYPSLAGNALLTPGAAAWTWGTWVVLSASLPSDYLPHGLHVTYSITPILVILASFRWEIEIATGAAASEVTYATIADAATCTSSPAVPLMLVSMGHTVPLGVTTIPSGTRVVARIRKSVPNTTNIMTGGLYLTGHHAPAGDSDLTYPLDGHLEGDNSAMTKVTPAGGTLAPTPPAYPDYGAWLEVIASAPNDLLVHGSIVETPVSMSNPGHHLQLGIGAAPDEVAFSLLGCPIAGMGQGNGVQLLRRPLLVLAGERLAIRAAGGGVPTLHQILYEEL